MPVGETDKLEIQTIIGVSTISSFGESLKAERERQGYDIEAVAEETKIRKLYLKALEEEKFNILPPRVYAIGFVKRYAQFLNLNAEQWTNEFQRIAYPSPEAQEPAAIPRRKSTRKLNIPVKNIIAAALFLLIVIWAGDFMVAYIAQKGAAQPPSVQQPEVKQSQEAPQPPTTPAKLIMVVEARQNCWLQIQIDGQQHYTGIITAGDKKTFEAASTITIKAGNAGGIDLTINNQPLASLGEVGQVVERQFDIKSIVKE